MTEADLGPQLTPEQLSRHVEKLTPQAGDEIVHRIAQQAEERNYSGLGIVFNADHEQLASLATGKGAHIDQMDVIMAKIRTVLATRRSISRQIEAMREKGRTREDYGGKLGGLIRGGAAIFKDPECKIFHGAAAYGGGPEDQDEVIVRNAVESIGLFTDLPQPEEK